MHKKVSVAISGTPKAIMTGLYFLEVINSIINHQLLPGNMPNMSFCPNDHTVPVFGILDNVHF